jgi:hypothetical protein
MNPPVMTRKQAMVAGEKFYYTGFKCQRGHLSPRYVNGGCVACAKYVPLAQRAIPPTPRSPSVNWLHLTEAQIDAWYARIDQIQQRAIPKRKHRPLEERPIIYMPRIRETA